MPKSPIWVSILMFSIHCAAWARQPDLSDPKGAAKAFLTALTSGDAEGLRASIIDPTPHEAFIVSWSNMIGSLRNLKEAAIAKFGESGEAFKEIEKLTGGNFAGAVDSAHLQVDGDTATLAARGGRAPMRLKRVDGIWKCDMASVQPNSDQATIERLDKFTRIATLLATEITEGKYESATKALVAFNERLKAFQREATSKPAR